MAILDPLAYIPAAGGGAAPRYLSLEASMANRHGVIAGATGTGKTVTLHSLAERLSNAGVAVFLADAKGDLAGMASPGKSAAEGGNPKIDAAIEASGQGGKPRPGLPVAFWDVFDEQGHPLRATISGMGPLVLGRALALSETQAEVLSIVFRIADDRGLLLLDLKDLRAVLDFCMKNAPALEPTYGRMAQASLGAIQRGVVVLEGQGGDRFFGEPSLEIAELLKKDGKGRGLVHILAANRLLEAPALYVAFMLWLLSELFEDLPEAGDLPAPKLVFFFDEAHLIFDGAPAELVASIARTVRLIRSKGVGVWFVTQNPTDIAEDVLAQLGNRVQHALRAYTEKERRSLRAAADSFRPNPKLDAEAALGELGVGEALVSLLDAQGVPAPVERARIAPPLSRVGPLDPAERAAAMKASPYAGVYDQTLDRASAYEALRGGAAPDRASTGGAGPAAAAPVDLDAEMAALEAELRGEVPIRETPSPAAYEAPAEPAPKPRARREPAERPSETEALFESVAKSALRAAGTEVGRQLVRGLLGGLSGTSRRRRRY